jgi:hypothetical protein
MAFQVADRVKETSTTTGTGTLDLGGAPDTYETFVAGVGGGNTTYYSIANRAANEWEVGIGTVTDAATDTLSRDTVISSSNSDALVNFSAGTKDVICTLPSSKSYVLDNSGDTTISADLSVTSVSGSGAGLTTLNASNLASGTLPDARFPATLPAASGANLTGLNASNLASGTVPDARFPATIPASSGANLTNLNASNVSSGTLSSDRLPTVPTTKGGTGLTAIGTANQVLAVNSGGTALEYQTISADIEGVTAGNGLTGGGTSGTVTLNVGAGALIDVSADAVDVDLSELTDMTEAMVGTDEFVVLDASSQKRKAAQEINLSIFNNDLPGDIEGVTAGNGLTGGGTSGTVTLNVGAGTGVTVNADDIAIGQDVATSASPTFAGATFTANVSLSDNDYLRLGTSQDLQIYHSGTVSRISDVGTGNLEIQATNLRLQNANGLQDYAFFTSGGAAALYYNGASKIATTATGISVTGTVVESSSLAYKENVQPLDFNDAIYNVNAVKYDRKDGSAKDEVGVIAEELYKVLPDLVECKDGKPEAVKYTKMTMYLLEALKKQNQEIQLLKEKLNG